MKTLRYIFIITSILLLHSCIGRKISNTPAFTNSNHLNAVIEKPAQISVANSKVNFGEKFKSDSNYSESELSILFDQIGNYGFIAGTINHKATEGDGKPVEIMILANPERTGKIIEVKPIGILKLIEKEKLDYKVIALPVTSKNTVLEASSFIQLQSEYPNILKAVEIWFQNKNSIPDNNIVGWGDEKEAIAFVSANLKK